MRASHFLLSCLVGILCIPDINAKSIKDTLRTADGDRIILSYDVSHSDNSYTIQFSSARKILGMKNSSRYKDPDKIAVLFFDRTGNFPKDVSMTDMVPEAFMVPSTASYERSSEGYFVVQDCPAISFSANGNCEVRIPVYLAYHPKRGRYQLFACSKALKIKMSPVKAAQVRKAAQPGTETVEQTITSTTEVEGQNDEELKILESVSSVRAMLGEADRLPFSESLMDEVSFLRQKKHEVTDKNLSDQISDVLEGYETRKAELEDQASAEQKAEQQKAEQRAADAAQAEKARNDSIQQAQQLAAEKDKRNNLWMIVGGVILAILAFVGNQLFQNYRNNKNQKRMAEMQKSISDKAEADAKKMARDARRNAANTAMRRKTPATPKQGKGQNNNFSI